MKITIIGTGFVGVTSSVVYASFGHQVIGLDIDPKKVDSLNAGQVPFYEPKLAEMLSQGIKSQNLIFTTSYQEAISQSDIIIIAVGTPSNDQGAIDLSYIKSAVTATAPYLKENAILAIKSTVLPGTIPMVKEIITSLTNKVIHYASLPEFLKEGTAVDDTLYPDRVVIGVETDFAFEALRDLHAPLKAPILRVRPESAQLAKYASNDYLALRIVYANVLAHICEHSQADIDEVLAIMGHEKRIGSHYWYPGLGYGGSCFPKDVKALAHYIAQFNFQPNLFAVIDELNSNRPAQILAKLVDKLKTFKNKKIAILGLAFKPNTDDQREAPALAIIPQLLTAGAQVIAYDPMVKQIADPNIAQDSAYSQVDSLDEAIKDADLIIALIEWPQIIGFDYSKRQTNKTQFFFDARNQFEAEKLTLAGYHYFGIGR